jgi:hypothetical protein
VECADVRDDLYKIKAKGWGGLMENREDGGRLFRRPKLTLSCSAGGKAVSELQHASKHVDITSLLCGVYVVQRKRNKYKL